MAVFTYNKTNGSITLAWDANSEPDLSGYKVYYGTSSGTYTTTIDVGNVTTYTLSGVFTPYVTYYFAVTAYNSSAQESGFSNEVNLIPTWRIIMGGTATYSKSSHRSYTASGSITMGGTATKSKRKVYAPSGAITMGGSGVSSFHSGGIHTYTASGSIVMGGTAAWSRRIVLDATPGVMTMGGSGSYSFNSVRKIYSYIGNGAILAGGTAPIVVKKIGNVIPSAISMRGSSPVTFAPVTPPTTFSYVASGAMVLGGAGVNSRTIVREGSGAMIMGGSANALIRVFGSGSTVFSPTPTGAMTMGGSASIAVVKNYTGSGSMVMGGSALVSTVLDTFENNQTFRLFKQDCEVRIKEWGSSAEYQTVRPFGGPHQDPPSGAEI